MKFKSAKHSDDAGLWVLSVQHWLAETVMYCWLSLC